MMIRMRVFYKKPMILFSFFFFLALVIASSFFLFRIFFVGSGQPVLPMGTLTIGPASYSVEIADTGVSRMRGLSGRASLAQDTGMLFVFPIAGRYGFWMKGMRFPLDFVWISGGVVSGVSEGVPAPSNPFNLPSYYPPDDKVVDMIVEFPAGTIARTGITAGMSVALVRDK